MNRQTAIDKSLACFIFICKRLEFSNDFVSIVIIQFINALKIDTKNYQGLLKTCNLAFEKCFVILLFIKYQ